jgi:two-component system, OmpR family, response regulator RegX3
VLLVEDEASISQPFSRALAREGFVPVVAPTAAEARAALQERDPDVVLLDLMLPDVGGGRAGPRAARLLAATNHHAHRSHLIASLERHEVRRLDV